MAPWIVAALGLTLAGAVHRVTGFGFGLVSMVAMTSAFPLTTAVPVVAVFLLLVNLLLGWQLREELRPSAATPLLLGAALGLPVGVVFLREVDASVVKAALGVVLLAYVGLRLRGAGHLAPPGRRWGLLAGLVGGILGGAFNTPLPPVTMYVSAQRWSPDAQRATLQLFSLATTTAAIGLFAAAGIVTADTLRWNVVLVPTPLVGIALGHRLARRISGPAFTRGVLVLLAIAGVTFVAQVVR